MKVPRDIVVIGASAGSLETLPKIVASLPPQFGASVFVVVHIGRRVRTTLPNILTRAGPLPAAYGRDREPISPGRIYVAPPDCHMTLEAGRVRLSRGPREHFTRPAIDPLFRSAAATYGKRSIGLVLSGMGRDGTAGLSAIRRAGGIVLVQDPTEATCPSMPRSAIEYVAVNAVVPSLSMPALLVRLVGGEDIAAPITPGVPTADRLARVRHRTIAGKEEASMGEAESGLERPIALTCPECGGAMHEERVNGLVLYRCHTGHRFAAEDVATGQLAEVEHAVNVALRVLNERAELCRRMATQLREAGHAYSTQRWEKSGREAEQQAEALRRLLAREWLQPEKDEEPAANVGA
jgi:two-component system chemotaxis response regulator CheB